MQNKPTETLLTRVTNLRAADKQLPVDLIAELEARGVILDEEELG